MATPNPPPDRVPADAPLGAIMHAVLEYLRSVLRPVPSSELAAALGVDVDRRPELASELEANPKCLREVSGEWRWRSKHYLRSAAELASLLRRCPNGIVSEELWDAYAGIKEDIEVCVGGFVGDVGGGGKASCRGATEGGACSRILLGAGGASLWSGMQRWWRRVPVVPSRGMDVAAWYPVWRAPLCT